MEKDIVVIQIFEHLVCTVSKLLRFHLVLAELHGIAYVNLKYFRIK